LKAKFLKELTAIKNKLIDSRNIKRIMNRAHRDKAELAAFAAWFSISALCFTIFICADHAVDAIAAKRGANVKAAAYIDIDSESTVPETGSEQLKPRPHGSDGRAPRPKPGKRGKDALSKSSGSAISFIRVSAKQACGKCKPAPETTQNDTTDESQTEAAETAVPINPDASTKSYNWYCKNNDTHARPALPSEFNFMTKNNGVWQGPEGCGKVIYLTFDAGYENGNVSKILDILREKQVSGAFFILDNLARRNPEIVKRMADEGHLVCNHTSHHKDMTALSAEEFTSELTSLENTVREFAGVELDKYYRPPCGALSERDLNLASSLGYKTVMWSYAYADWDNKSQMVPTKALEKLMAHTHEGMVLLLHPTSSTNTEILDDFIDNMTSQGWRFGRLDELVAS
jgi:Predicted xylanase/chitin deacetylase